MERKSVDIFLPYTDKGETKNKVVKISFLSNRMIREFNALNQDMIELLALYSEYEEVNRKILDVFKALNRKIKERKGEYEELNAEKIRLEELINAKATEDFFKRKIDFIIGVLVKNGCSDKEILTFEFWDESVEPADITVFLKTVMSKDADPQKKKSE